MSPLTRRLPREFIHNLGKYVGIFFLIGITVALASGFLVVDRSIVRIIDETRKSANLQDFSFTTQFEADDEALDHVRNSHGGIEVVEDFYADLDLSYDGLATDEDRTVRLYATRDSINKVSYNEGRAATADDEITLDRNFMEANGLEVGDTVVVDGQELEIVGQVVMPDYECMMRKSTDLMFEAQSFTVAQVTQGAFDKLSGDGATFHYICRFDERGLSLEDRTTAEQAIARSLEDEGVSLTEILDNESTPAITFVDEDLVSDGASMEIMLYLVLFISAFIFVVLTNATVEQESAVIGTLLASGYRTGELVRHYMTLPVLVGLLAAVVGNAVGYAYEVTQMADLYYHSYSLPTFHAYFDTGTFIETTVVPVVLLVIITYGGIRRKLGATPLAFLRGEVGRRSRRSNAHFPESWSFVRKFRSRVFLRNAANFAVLFLGIAFSSLLMLFGMGMMPLVRHAANQMADAVRAGHVYILKAPLEIDETPEQRQAAAALKEMQSAEDPEDDIDSARLATLLARAQALEGATHAYNTEVNPSFAVEDAEKFCVTSLEIDRTDGEGTETVSIYGVEVGSDYWDDIDVSGGKIVIGRGLVEKYGFALGSPITLTNKFTGDTYQLAPVEVAGNGTDTNIYMSRATFLELFDNVTGGDADYFNGYASDRELALDERYVSSEITPGDMSGLADQMDESMGRVMTIMLWMAVPVSIILIYLLTKTVIDRSARSISYMKVFGYHSREIDTLYLRPVTWTVVGSYVLSIPLVIWGTSVLMKLYLQGYSGNIEVYIDAKTMAGVLAIGIATYLVVAAIHMLRIRRVPLALALKVQE